MQNDILEKEIRTLFNNNTLIIRKILMDINISSTSFNIIQTCKYTLDDLISILKNSSSIRIDNFESIRDFNDVISKDKIKEFKNIIIEKNIVNYILPKNHKLLNSRMYMDILNIFNSLHYVLFDLNSLKSFKPKEIDTKKIKTLISNNKELNKLLKINNENLKKIDIT